jgi:hypothetical protein
MRFSWLLFLIACSSSAEPSKTPPTNPSTTPTDSGSQGSQAMTNDPNQPGGTGVDENGVLLRSKPDPNAPQADPKLVADDDSNLLFYAGALVGDPAKQRKVWIQLGLADANGAPTPKMTDFIRAHQVWVKDKASLAASVASQAKASAYLDTHLK